MNVCSPIPLGCDVCFNLTLSQTNLTVSGGLTPSVPLYLWVTDKFDNQYRVLITTDGTGAFTINEADFPEGMFNLNAGAFNLFVTSDINGTLVVPFTSFSFLPYQCINLTITC